MRRSTNLLSDRAGDSAVLASETCEEGNALLFFELAHIQKMRQNNGMYENFRLFFSILWLAATGCLLAAGFVVLVTWGGYLDYFYSVLGIWCIATVGTIATSL